MSEKNYNFDNFDETKVYGKHFKPDPPEIMSNDNFDFEDSTIKSFDTKSVDSLKNDKDIDYGDDFYSDASGFENNDTTDYEVTPSAPVYSVNEYQRQNRTRNNEKELKKKNSTIAVLSVLLAITLIVFSLVLLFNSLKNNDNNDTNESTKATQTVKTEAVTQEVTQEQTEAPTEEATDAPTEEVTEAPTEEQTEAPTEEITEPPTEEITFDENQTV